MYNKQKNCLCRNIYIWKHKAEISIAFYKELLLLTITLLMFLCNTKPTQNCIVI